MGSLSDDLEEGAEVLTQDDEDRRTLIAHTLNHLAGVLTGLAHAPRPATSSKIDRITALADDAGQTPE